MKVLKRWAGLNKAFLTGVGLILFFAFMDVWQINGWSQVVDANKWVIYEGFSAPSIFALWVASLAVLGLVWFFATNDKSEAVALFVSPLLLLLFGLEDLFVYVITGQAFPACLSWLNDNVGVGTVSKVLGSSCVTGSTLAFSVVIGVVLSYVVFKWLRNRW